MSVKKDDCCCDYDSHDSDDSDELKKPCLILMMEKSEKDEIEIDIFDGKAPWQMAC